MSDLPARVAEGVSLTEEEEDQLAVYEAKIEEYQQEGRSAISQARLAFWGIGASLKAIKDSKLYRSLGTFEKYCQTRWDYTPQHANRLIGAAAVIENLKSEPIGSLLPANEAQVRELSALTPEQQRAVWAEVQDQANGKPITAKQIEKMVSVLTNATANIHVSDDSYEWYTPEAYIEAARELMGGIDLDPCTSEDAQAVVRAGHYFTRESDGLAQPWGGRVWMNPPFSAELVNDFTLKLLREVDARNVTAAVLLVNNATDTQWFHRYLVRFPVCFTLGRVRFWKPGEENLATRQGQAIFSIGNEAARFSELFSRFGAICFPYVH